MSAFTNAADWSEPIGGIKYRVKDPLVWLVGSVSTGASYTVPVGFRFDGTVPKLARWLFSPHNPKYRKAFALHDWFLHLGWDRFTAGAQFHEALKADGVGRVERAIMSLAVLFFKYS